MEPSQTTILHLASENRALIFRYLPTADLINAGVACKSFLSSALNEFRRRRHELLTSSSVKCDRILPMDNIEGRFGHQFCYHSPLQRVYLCGGLSKNGALMNDVKYYDLHSETWVKVAFRPLDGIMPSKCAFGSLVSMGESMVLFGGYTNSETSGMMCKLYIMNPLEGSWAAKYFANSDLKLVWGHSALVDSDQMICVGGQRKDAVEVLSFVCYDEHSNQMWNVLQRGEIPRSRVQAAIALPDRLNLILFGGRDRLNSPNTTLYHDGFIFTFDSFDRKSGFWRRLEIENSHLLPKCLPSFASHGEQLFLVSRPVDCTRVLVRSDSILMLLEAQNERKQRAEFISNNNCVSSDLCLRSLAETRRQFLRLSRGIKSGGYPDDHMTGDATEEVYQYLPARYSIYRSKPSFVDIIRLARFRMEEYYASKRCRLLPDDFEFFLNWLSSTHHTIECGIAATSFDHTAICFMTGGCVYRAVKNLFHSIDEDFHRQICAILSRINDLTESRQRLPIDPLFPPVEEFSFWRGVREGYLIPLTDILMLYPLVPVYRLVLDIPMSATLFKMDLSNAASDCKIRLTQQPVQLFAPTFAVGSPMVMTPYGIMLAGGVGNSMNELVPDAAPMPSPVADTILFGGA